MSGLVFPIESQTTSTAPAAGTQASVTITTAASGFKHVLTGIFATVYGTATGTNLPFNIVGVVNSGTTIYRDGFMNDGPGSDRLILPCIFMPCPSGDAVTASFGGSPAAGTRQTITLSYVTTIA